MKVLPGRAGDVRGGEFLLLELGDGVTEAEGEGEKEVPDGAALADVGDAVLLDDAAPVGGATSVVAGPLEVVIGCRPEHSMLGKELGLRPPDNAVACWVEVESMVCKLVIPPL